MVVLIEDSRQQAGQHEIKHDAWRARGDVLFRCALPCGDYALPPHIAVDTKRNMAEIAGNIGGAEHERFKSELIRARDMGTKLVILVENEDGIRCIEDVERWVNPRLRVSPRAINGPRLAKAMKTLEERYGCVFRFCRPEESAAVIIGILESEDARKKLFQGV